MVIVALKALILGIVEGITEWLPISSTGHLIIAEELVNLDVSVEFMNLFLVVIQIGAIMAVIILYFHKLNPFSRKKTPQGRKDTWRLWGMVVIGCIPAAIVGLLADDWVHDHFYNALTVAIMLVVYGIVFIAMERHNRKKQAVFNDHLEKLRQKDVQSAIYRAKNNKPVPRARHIRDPKTGMAASPDSTAAMRAVTAADSEEYVQAQAERQSQQVAVQESDPFNQQSSIFRINDVNEIDVKTALKIGLFQVLAIIPGTSRSGATIIGGMLSGASRSASAEFTFFLAIPVMLGWGVVRLAKFIMSGLVMSQTEIVVLVVGVVSAFIVSVLSIKFLMNYIKKNDFTAFGWYRIIVGIVLVLFFGFQGALFVIQ